VYRVVKMTSKDLDDQGYDREGGDTGMRLQDNVRVQQQIKNDIDGMKTTWQLQAKRTQPVPYSSSK